MLAHTHTQDFQASSVSKGLLQCRDGFSNDADVGLMMQIKMLWTLACFCSSTACAMVKHSPKVCSSPSFFLWTHHGAVGPSAPSPHPHKPCVPGVRQVRPLHTASAANQPKPTPSHVLRWHAAWNPWWQPHQPSSPGPKDPGCQSTHNRSLPRNPRNLSHPSPPRSPAAAGKSVLQPKPTARTQPWKARNKEK